MQSRPFLCIARFVSIHDLKMGGNQVSRSSFMGYWSESKALFMHDRFGTVLEIVHPE
jgi:hypothetical protein